MARQKNPPAPAKNAQRGAGKKQSKGAAEGAPEGRVAQMLAVWKLTRDNDPKLLWVVFGPAVAVIAVLVVVGILIGQPIVFSVIGVLGGV